ncbi:GNAT family N-acetyltransferase [Sphingomonas donggukensis]|uniref:GNAT family N-acetyltransferase n=1 Tax=Sphingomonas donggukensis TaxID=2949093 RepID=A0ABY4TTU6_9SPHN|nr:GNAT family N-acetyltransferase [Sphingomonas donggukensis]URW74614.1 GNAT family N-acetyltransferase [Sphingomonas donggukensis]
MTVAIRPAVLADVPVILRFVRELAEYERAADKVVATETLLADALFAQQPAAYAVVAEVDGVPVGMALYFFNFSTWTGWRGLYLEDLYVTPDARGSGVGGALLTHLAGIAVARGCTRFEWAVLDWNAPAIAFYLSKGAEPMNEWRTYRVSGDALTRLAEGA